MDFPSLFTLFLLVNFGFFFGISSVHFICFLALLLLLYTYITILLVACGCAEAVMERSHAIKKKKPQQTDQPTDRHSLVSPTSPSLATAKSKSTSLFNLIKTDLWNLRISLERRRRRKLTTFRPR